VRTLDWLLDSDPSIRWQVMRDLLDSSPDEVDAERAKVSREGWGARLLALQGEDGNWGGGAHFPSWTATTWALLHLRAMALNPSGDQARRAVAPVGHLLAEEPIDDGPDVLFDARRAGRRPEAVDDPSGRCRGRQPVVGPRRRCAVLRPWLRPLSSSLA
jgi:hypothetical protein